MNNSTALNKAVFPTAARAARIASGSTIVFLIVLVALHIIKPEYDPSWRFISEYAIGPLGWIMMVAFIIWALSYLALYFALKPHVPKSILGSIGLGLLLISSLGLILAGVFVTDPVTATENERTTSGAIHSMGGTLGMAMPIAAILLTLALRKNPEWKTVQETNAWGATISTIGFLIAFVSMGVILSQSNGKFGPDVFVGWPNRLEVIGYCIWSILIAKCAERLS